MLEIGQITQKHGKLIVKVFKNYLDEASCPQAETDNKFPNKGEILTLLQILEKMIEYYYDITSNKLKRHTVTEENDKNQLASQLDILMKNFPQSACKVEYNKYIIHKNSNYRWILDIFEYISLIDFEISASIDILYFHEYSQNDEVAREDAKKYILQSLNTVRKIKESGNLEEKDLENVNKENLDYIKKVINGETLLLLLIYRNQLYF